VRILDGRSIGGALGFSAALSLSVLLASTSAWALVVDDNGINNDASGQAGAKTAVGDGANADNGSLAPNVAGTAIGSNANAGNINAPGTVGVTAVGSSSNAVGVQSTALGSNASTTGSNSVALGFNSSDEGRSNVVSVGTAGGGERQISNVAAGSFGTDAVNVNQLLGVQSSLQSGISSAQSTASSAQSAAAAAGSAAAAAQATANNSVQYDPGTRTSATLNPGGVAASLHNVANGVISASSKDAVNGSQLSGVQTIAQQGVAAGAAAQSTANQAVTAAAAAQKTANQGVAAAGAAQSTANQAVSAAGAAQMSANQGIAAAGAAQSTANQAVTAAAAAQTTANQGVAAAGAAQSTANQALSVANNSVQYDAGRNSVTFNPGGRSDALHNVAAGVISASSTDAINGAQLQQVMTSVQSTDTNIGSEVAANFGGGSSYNSQTSTLSAPSYTIAGRTFGNVGSALNAINTTGIQYFHTNSTLADSVATGANSVAIGPVAAAMTANSVALGNGAVAAANVGDVALGSGSVTSVVHTGPVSINGGSIAGANAASVVSIGAVGSERQLQNVAAGSITSTSTDAVNGSQLFAVGTQVNGLSQEINSATPTVVRYDTGPNGQPTNSITLTGAGNGGTVGIHNVAAGTSATDAVNLGQLVSAVNGAQSSATQQIGNLQNQVNARFSGDEHQIAKAKKTARAAGSVAAAASNLRFDDRPGKASVAAAWGHFQGSTALTAGAAYNFDNLRITATASIVPTSNETAIGGGASWTLW